MKGSLTKVYREIAAEGGNFWGNNILQHEAEIRRLVQQTGAHTLMDYGCGRGDPWRGGLAQRLGCSSHFLYDPAFRTHDVLPKQGAHFDGVLCSDVLEHVPENEVPAFVQSLFDYADRFVWASVCCRPAKKKLPDGTNMHVTVRPMEWWHAQFRAARPRNEAVIYRLTETP